MACRCHSRTTSFNPTIALPCTIRPSGSAPYASADLRRKMPCSAWPICWPSRAQPWLSFCCAPPLAAWTPYSTNGCCPCWWCWGRSWPGAWASTSVSACPRTARCAPCSSSIACSTAALWPHFFCPKQATSHGRLGLQRLYSALGAQPVPPPLRPLLVVGQPAGHF